MNLFHQPSILTIAGSDCSGGAGLQADLKTFQHFKLHGLSAVTCVVSETANLVRKIEMISVDMIEDQIRLLIDSVPIPVVKLGMLGSTQTVQRVAEIFAARKEVRLVIDPVMVASTGDRLLEKSATQAYREQLLPLAHIITPNLPEGEVILNKSINNIPQMETAAIEISEQFGCAVLMKGGHLEGSQCVDLLCEEKQLYRFSSPRIDTPASHGTGCTLAAALAANLALGHSLQDATRLAKTYLEHTLSTAYRLTGSTPPIHALNQGTLPFPT